MNLAAIASIIVVIVVIGGAGYVVSSSESNSSALSAQVSSLSSSVIDLTMQVSSLDNRTPVTVTSTVLSTTTTTVTMSGSMSTISSVSAACGQNTATSSTVNGTYALVHTNLGLIELELFPQYAPQTVANFVNMANQGFYNGLVWHRIDPGFVIQTGDPNTRNGGGNRSTWGMGTSGTSVPFEGPPGNPLCNIAGSVAMASTAAGIGGSSQFYINLVDNSASLDGNYAVFGQVISGMSVVNALAQVPIYSSSSSPEYDQPQNPLGAYIISITIQSSP